MTEVPLIFVIQHRVQALGDPGRFIENFPARAADPIEQGGPDGNLGRVLGIGRQGLRLVAGVVQLDLGQPGQGLDPQQGIGPPGDRQPLVELDADADGARVVGVEADAGDLAGLDAPVDHFRFRVETGHGAGGRKHEDVALTTVIAEEQAHGHHGRAEHQHEQAGQQGVGVFHHVNAPFAGRGQRACRGRIRGHRDDGSGVHHRACPWTPVAVRPAPRPGCRDRRACRGHGSP